MAAVIVKVLVSTTVTVLHDVAANHDCAGVVARSPEPVITTEPVEATTNRPAASTFEVVPSAEVIVTIATPSVIEIEPGRVNGGVMVGVGLTGLSSGSVGSSMQLMHGPGPVDGPVGSAKVCVV
jgi:hypothetical protein